MIRAMIFDMDGTLVQTEKLKAQSYAHAAVELCPDIIEEETVIEAFKEVVGQSRRKVATALLEKFNLEQAATERMDNLGVSRPWQAFVQVRLQYYESMLDDPDLLRQNEWPHNMDLLQQARDWNCRVALATSSTCRKAQGVLKALDLAEAFDFIATADDVEAQKPDPAIYELVAREIDILPASCLVIEDSPSGVEAAVAAGMHCIAVATPFTRSRLRQQTVLSKKWVVGDPEQLMETVGNLLRETT